ncbi:C-C chemokine receptor type 6-like [Ruditapes philippinarum]|uniref:C-C chemokine receptor type 6-like n=1 Tax=Ruditapes philippinarum TaxID=129788 RepID=UPI00295A8D59|nr:C-C chemokine receptor type 6-like [Ruditapes philippinarum]
MEDDISVFFSNATSFLNDTSNNTSPTEAPFVDERLQTAKDVMFTIQYALLPLFLVTGLFGNLFTIVTMASSRFQHLTSRYILIFLAISDTVLLLTQPFNKLWVIKMLGQDVRALSIASCKAFFVIFRSAKMTSSWLVVFLCFERFVAVVFPLKAKTIIRKRLILPAIAVNYFANFVYNSVWSFSSGVVNGICKPDLPSLKHYYFVIIGCSFYSFIPTALLIVFTPQIIVRLIRQTKVRRQLSTRSLTTSKSNAVKTSSNPVMSRSKRDEEMMRASIMVLGVMIAYIVLIIPITTVHIYSFTAGVSAFDVNSYGFFIYRELAQMLEQINYAVNFFFYVLCSSAFRGRVKEILCFTDCRVYKHNPDERSTSSIKQSTECQ